MKTVLITGASGGMGKETCKKFISAGYKVFALDKRILNEIEGVTYIQCDLSNSDEIQKSFKIVSLQTKTVDLIIHLAGIYMLDSLIEITEERIKKIFDINFLAVYKVNKIFYPLLKEGSRIIITTSELAPLDPLPFTGIYAITKGALDKYAYSLRMELQLNKIDVTTLRAGAVETPLLGDSTSELDKFVSNTKLYSCNAKKFKQIVNSVEARSVKPEKVGIKLLKISKKKKTKFAYKINNNFLLKLLNFMPRKLQLFIIAKILQNK